MLTVVVGRPWGVMTLPVVGQLRGEGGTVSPRPSVVPSATDVTPDRSVARRRALAAQVTAAGERFQASETVSAYAGSDRVPIRGPWSTT